ncbi:hypothetical protein CDLVIII_0855 [Clostridium sp. DL-VIII]|uniref:hypothetical protein n=1 Tax=Clostridium sp. DL-VIII TaxID=641107 RepID=UPI00023AF11B|nr:hypothetical protein [Clostridium sp. DL-VIII]EHI97579.1 hypothetical protein CDLVIII_0855 [Clostridium sp. DL-VIII]
MRELLGKEATHFNVITQEFEGLITGETERFNDYVFPRELDDRIEEEIKKLNDKLILLE